MFSPLAFRLTGEAFLKNASGRQTLYYLTLNVIGDKGRVVPSSPFA